MEITQKHLIDLQYAVFKDITSNANCDFNFLLQNINDLLIEHIKSSFDSTFVNFKLGCNGEILYIESVKLNEVWYITNFEKNLTLDQILDNSINAIDSKNRNLMCENGFRPVTEKTTKTVHIVKNTVLENNLKKYKII